LCRIKLFEWNPFARPRDEMPIETLLIIEIEDSLLRAVRDLMNLEKQSERAPSSAPMRNFQVA
jgi:hypothetical protein